MRMRSKMGRHIMTFRRTLVWPFFITIMYLFVMFIWSAMSNDLGIRPGFIYLLFTT